MDEYDAANIAQQRTRREHRDYGSRVACAAEVLIKLGLVGS